MPLLFALQDELVSVRDLPFKTSIRENHSPSAVFHRGRIEGEENGSTLTREAPVSFTSIGIGKPISIWLKGFYTGDLPSKGIKRRKSMLLSSAVKNTMLDLAPCPPALNLLKRTVSEKQLCENPDATEYGRQLIYYSPALVEDTLTVSIQVAFNDIPENQFRDISDLLKSSATVPVFLAAAPYLLVASGIIKIAGRLANFLFDSKSEFTCSEVINLEIPGAFSADSGFYLMTRNSDQERELKKDFRITETGELVHKSDSSPYKGNIAYAILAVDGQEKKENEKFTRQAISAALLSDYYNMKESEDRDTTVLMEALQLYNDFHFREKAEKKKKELEGEQDEKVKAKLTQEYNALVANILNEQFKLNKLT